MKLFDNLGLSVNAIALSEANDFIKKKHRHNGCVVGHKMSFGLYRNGELCGVAILGRPTSRHLQDKGYLEITRVCVIDNVPNGCSKLYGAAVKQAKKFDAFGVVTFTLMSERGSSVKAANFKLDAENVGGKKWTGKRKYVSKTGELKRRWVYHFKKDYRFMT